MKLKNIYKTNFTITAWCKLNSFTDLAPIFGSFLSIDKGFPGIFFRAWGGYEGVFAPYENNEVLLHRSFSTFDRTAWCFYSVTRDRSTGLDYLGVNGVVTCPTPSIADADITVEGSGIWQFGIKMDDSVNAYNTILYVFDKDSPLQIMKYSDYEYYDFDYKKIIFMLV